MTEPRRWTEEGAPPAIERLVRAAASEKPQEASLARTLGALGVGLGTAGAASTAGATAGAAAAATSVSKASGVLAAGAFVKWGLLATAVTAAGVAGKVAVTRSDDINARVPAVPSMSTLAPAPRPRELTPAAPLTGSAPVLEPEVPPAARPAATVAPARPATRAAVMEEPPVDAERLAEEVALVDRARAALARGDAPAALTALDDYEARFKERRFVPEALYLRMESLLRMGKGDAAREVARRIVTSFAKSPHAARARQVLGSIP
jgi:TolA-binding protein